MCTITAPDDEPQRGTVIQADQSGKIETTPDDRGGSRIVSRAEFMDRPENQPTQRPDNQSGFLRQINDKDAAIMDMFSQVPKQAFGVPEGGDPDPRLKAIPTDPSIARKYEGALPGSSPQLAARYRLARKQPTTGNPLFDSLDLFDEARYLQSGIPELANMPYLGDQVDAYAANFRDTGPSLAPPPMQPAADMPYTGIEQSLAREAQAGRLRNQSEDYKDFFFNEGQRMLDANPLENYLMDIRDKAQGIMGYEDGMRGLYEMDKDKKVAEKNYQEGQRQRNKDKDNQKSPFDPCPEGFVYNAVKGVCEPVNEVEGEAELGTKFTFNQATPPDFKKYGQTGGEFNFFTEMPGVAKPNIYKNMALGGKGLDSLPRAAQGETKGKIKEDKEGPFMLSGSEYVLPTEQIIEIGNGDYNNGIKTLDSQRYKALRKYKDRVEQLKT